MIRNKPKQSDLFCMKLAGAVKYGFTLLFVYMLYQWWTMPPAWEMRCMLAVVCIADFAAGWAVDEYFLSVFRKFKR